MHASSASAACASASDPRARLRFASAARSAKRAFCSAVGSSAVAGGGMRAAGDPPPVPADPKSAFASNASDRSFLAASDAAACSSSEPGPYAASRVGDARFCAAQPIAEMTTSTLKMLPLVMATNAADRSGTATGDDVRCRMTNGCTEYLQRAPGSMSALLGWMLGQPAVTVPAGSPWKNSMSVPPDVTSSTYRVASHPRLFLFSRVCDDSILKW